MTTPFTYSDTTTNDDNASFPTTTEHRNLTNDTCKANNNFFTIGFIPIKFIVAMLNSILFTAIVRDWKRLQRQNYTFHCVSSTLLGNTAYLIVSIWLTVDNYPQVETDTQEGRMTTEKYLWLISEAVLATMILGIGANVTSLTYVTLDSAFYVGRAGTGWGASSRDKQTSMISKVRCAKALVIFSWVVPFALTSLTFWWNCAEKCKCPSNNFSGEHCRGDERCSHMWAPLRIEFLTIVTVVWLIEITGLIIFLACAIRNHLKSLKAPTDPEVEHQLDASGKVGSASQDNEIKCGEEKVILSPTRRHSNFKIKFNSRLRFGTYLTLLLVCCTMPAAVSSLVDAHLEYPPYQELILMSGLFMFFYCAICPILMWKFLPSLRSSTLKLRVSFTNSVCRKSRDKRHQQRGNTKI